MTKNVIQSDVTYENALIIGGGDLRIAMHVLKKFPNVKKLVNCELDQLVTDTCARFFPFDSIIE